MKDSRYKPYIMAGVTALIVIFIAILTVFTFYHFSALRAFFDLLGRVLRPIFLGMILAFLLLPIHRGILATLKTLIPKSLQDPDGRSSILNFISVMVSMAFAFLLIYLFMAMLVPQLYLSIVGIIKAFPKYINSIQIWLLNFWEDNPELQSTIISFYASAAHSLEAWLTSDILPNLESLASTMDWIRKTVLPNLTGVVSGVSTIVISFISLMADVLIAFIVSIYLLIRKDTFAAQSKKIVYSLFAPKYGDIIVEETRNAYRIMSGFINGKLVDSLIIGLITLFSCEIFNFPYPVLIATVIGVTNVIPFFGPFIGAIPCAILVFLISPIKCVYFVIYILVIQQFDGNILGPRILGESTGLASFWVLFSILLFGGLFGFAGMVLGVPVFAIFYSIVNRLVRRGLRRHGLPVETKHYIGKTGPMHDTANLRDILDEEDGTNS